MKNFKIYIPTSGRTAMKAYDSIPEKYQYRTFLVMDQENYDSLFRGEPYNVLISDPGVSGIAATRQWIFENHDPLIDGEVMIQLDDDLTFKKRNDDNRKRSHKASPEEVGEMIEGLVQLTNETPICSIPEYLFSNYYTEPIKESGRITSVICLDMPAAIDLGITMNGVDHSEDADTALQFLTRGFPVLFLNDFTHSDTYNADGGCSQYRTTEFLSSNTNRMKERWGEFIRVKNLGGHHAITVLWSKALKHGRADIPRLVSSGAVAKELYQRFGNTRDRV